MPVDKCWDVAKRYRLCFRCFGDDHRGDSCVESRKCGIDGCVKLHNRLLHSKSQIASHNRVSKQTSSQKSTEGEMQVRTHNTQGNSESVEEPCTALRTVPIIVRNGSRRLQINALLDDGSTKSYINADVAAELGLHAQTQKMTVNVLNGKCETFQTMPVNFQIESLDGYIKKQVTAFTTNKVTGKLRVVDWRRHAERWSHLRGIKFPKYNKKTNVDMLIGIDYADLHFSKRDVRGRPGEPVARLTPLGWTCVGSPYDDGSLAGATNFASSFFLQKEDDLQSTDALLRRFWEIKEVSKSSENIIVSQPDKIAMESVKSSLSLVDERYQIGTPWKLESPSLPNNYPMAAKRLKHTEQRLKRNPEIASAYCETIKRYEQKGYISKITPGDEKTKWYLPHFPVIKPEKTTTKTRIVFDASAKFENTSLNDAIFKGPKLQRDLFDILQRFRRYPVAIVCDIAEMYLQIGLAPDDRPYHRFLWRGMSENQQPDIYQFNRVVFGVNSSPFQAQYVCQHHAELYEDTYPRAAETIKHSTYMDDSLDSVPTVREGIDLYLQLTALWSKAGMYARKWLSNSPEVLKEIPQSDRSSEIKLDDDQSIPSTKTLGVLWRAEEDVLTFDVHDSFEFKNTKRDYLSKIAALFDPLGLVSPFTVLAKLIMQEMWQAGIDWDEPLDENLRTQAKMWFDGLPELRNVKVPRCLQTQGKVSSTSYHTFVDASEKAYGAVVYSRHVYEDGSISTRLVASKTRVAPLKSISIPRMELLGAVLGLKLSQSVGKALDVQLRNFSFWSDSMDVLWWIRGRSRSFKPFVANRVGEIQSSTNPEQWRHVPTKENPADLMTRGMFASVLIHERVWWEGPIFLTEAEDSWPTKRIVSSADTGEEKKGKMKHVGLTLMTVETEDKTFRLKPDRHSDWKRLVRINAWVNRFLNNCRISNAQRIKDELTADELFDSESQIIRAAQQRSFPEEYKAVTRKTGLSNSSKLLSLNPRLDETGVLRCDGRLKFAEFLASDVRYPIILPRYDWVTRLIIKHYHENGNHSCGTNHTLASLSTRFWIISAREAIREWENICAECKRQKAKRATQIMAPLPQIRFKTPLRAFAHTAVDYAGPFVTIQGRGQRRQKRYLCLFTCLATRAVHLEVAYRLDTDSFLNSFYRFVNRRGVPQEIISNNGTNFKGAQKELKQLVLMLDQNKIQRSSANKGIKWNFIPPLAPHFGGVHETMIKAAKKAIVSILQNADINDEELTTAFTGAESLLNSRPLTYQSASPNDSVPLTPSHFMHGQLGGQFAPDTVDTTSFSIQKRWRRVQELVRHFWQRWLREWLPGLNARRKWMKEKRDFVPGDIVLVISPETPRGQWPLGRVDEVYKGADGHVRTVKVQIGDTSYIRPIGRLCPLELDAEQ